ncbi:branched chain amino acid aminotransferase [Frondihabitans sp. PAMC 28766]|uniref:branched-chain amino acid aminotransferase n=1 Tax=Frondihabitans sp. PAMC 28766 TaxID=1795630 RepID=UPI00078EB9C0|nr:branched-chain amino acid aminotransferase [Frondihabitans sp. PAMC 28766]AMM21299.1 branched chain amino acid aminotransferase [Frondihabitans sp. PAMC 28766]
MTTTQDTYPLHFELTPSDSVRADAEREEMLSDPGFGKYFTDHMVEIEWTVDDGWHDAAVVPYGPISLDPAASVFHYAQEIFEGVKAYAHADGSVWTFRPEANGRRLQRSAKRLALPELAVDDFVESLKQIVRVDQKWVPTADETSLYLRPFMIATESFLGVRAAHKVGYYVIASPAGAYFTGGVAPVSIWLSENFSRAGKGGTGAAKTGGNYAASLLPQEEAYAHGCSQVLFLDSVDTTYIEELGGMNVVLVYKDGTLVTPDSDSILEGVTRDSILQLAEDRGHKTERRRVSLDEWKTGVESGDIVEVFACGTAAVVVPIAELKGEGFSVVSPVAGPDSLTLSLRTELTDIQYGRRPDPHGWLTRLDA